ncbi:MAG TPA: TetR/AcrR family transcriptional regulator [Candidatus Limnocylindrales bacterium]|nr:TetR/AcrR family transcriptional regulator [Candidatus Limnocylindrales bacterium]
MTRRYIQRARAEAAQQTRRQILDAARAAVLTGNRLEFSVGEIAEDAGVARSTIYSVFGSRAGLLSALADDTLQRAGLAEVIAAYGREDASEALEGSLRASCRMYAAEHPVFARLLVLARIDPEAAEPLSRSERDRATGMAHLAARLAVQRRLRAGVSVEHAVDVLSLLTSFWSFDELFSGRGLDADASSDVLLEIARSIVLPAGDPLEPRPAGA